MARSARIPARLAAFARALLPLAAGSALGTAALLTALPAWAAGLAAIALAATLLIYSGRKRRRIDALSTRLERIAPPSIALPTGLARLTLAVDAVEDQFGEIEQRFTHRHRVTGLPTREPLLQAMADAGGGVLGTISFADFDRMCAFDSSLGEQVIVALAERITRMVGRGRMLAHVDRAQFALWFGEDRSLEAAQAQLQALTYALGDRLDIGGSTLQPQVRAGCVELTPGEAPGALLTRGLAALSGDTPADTGDAVAAARDSFALEQDLREAVLRGQLALHFQPLVDAPKGMVCGAEALIRWHHPEHGLISPAQFVPMVERMGLADEIGLWAMNAACREAARWRKAGLGDLTVAVNASGHQLERADMLQLVQRTLARHALPPGCLEIELTETVAADDIDRAARLFGDLRAAGVRIAIDDFGTGFSSLSALRRLAFDKIKIDREFVSHVDSRADSQAICQSIIALARGLGIRVLAEGVERQEEYHWLRAHGCGHFQGFHFSRPLDADAFITFVRNRVALRRLVDVDPRALRSFIQQRLSA